MVRKLLNYKCLGDVESSKIIDMKDTKKKKKGLSPEQSWYSGICLTVVTWRLSGSRQLHKAPNILTKRFNYKAYHHIIMLLLSHPRKKERSKDIIKINFDQINK